MSKIKWTEEKSLRLVNFFRANHEVLLGGETTADGLTLDELKTFIVEEFNNNYEEEYDYDKLKTRFKGIRDQLGRADIKVQDGKVLSGSEAWAYNHTHDFLLQYINHKSSTKKHCSIPKRSSLESEIGNGVAKQLNNQCRRNSEPLGYSKEHVPENGHGSKESEMDDDPDMDAYYDEVYEAVNARAAIQEAQQNNQPLTEEDFYNDHDYVDPASIGDLPSIPHQVMEIGHNAVVGEAATASGTPVVDQPSLEDESNSTMSQEMSCEVPPIDFNFPKRNKATKNVRVSDEVVQEHLSRLSEQLEVVNQEMLAEDMVGSIHDGFQRLEKEKKTFAYHRILKIMKKYS